MNDDLFDIIMESAFRTHCFGCGEKLDKNKYITAHKNGCEGYFCRKCIDKAENYLDYYLELIEPKGKQNEN